MNGGFEPLRVKPLKKVLASPEHRPSRSLDSVAAARSVGPLAQSENPLAVSDGAWRFHAPLMAVSRSSMALTQVLKRVGRYQNVCLSVTSRA